MDEASLMLVRDTLLTALKIVAPILAAGVAIGLLISIIQSITSIQDQTLTFVPKIFVMIGVAAVLLSWIAQRLADFTIEMFKLVT